MRACRAQCVLLGFLLIALHWTRTCGESVGNDWPAEGGGEGSPHGEGQFFFIFPVVQNISCEVSQTLSLEDDPSRTFNWTSKAEICNPGEFCQETVLLIKAGKTERWTSAAGPALQATAVQLSRWVSRPNTLPVFSAPFLFTHPSLPLTCVYC